jgi:hypothetical protein
MMTKDYAIKQAILDATRAKVLFSEINMEAFLSSLLASGWRVVEDALLDELDLCLQDIIESDMAQREEDEGKLSTDLQYAREMRKRLAAASEEQG